MTNDQQALRSAQVDLQNQLSQVQATARRRPGLQGAHGRRRQGRRSRPRSRNADQIRAQIASATIVSPIDGDRRQPQHQSRASIRARARSSPCRRWTRSTRCSTARAARSSASEPGSNGQHQLRPTARRCKAAARVVAVLDELTPGSTNFTIKVVLPNPQGLVSRRDGRLGTSFSCRRRTGSASRVTAFTDDTQTRRSRVVSNGVGEDRVPVTMVAQDGKNAVVTGLHRGDAGDRQRPTRPRRRTDRCEPAAAGRVRSRSASAMWLTTLFVRRPTLVFVLAWR